MWRLGEGLGTDMGEFWDRHWRSYYCRGLGGLGQRLGMLTLGGGPGGCGLCEGGLGTDIGYVNIVGPGVGGQRLGILYFWRGGSVPGYYGDRHWR